MSASDDVLEAVRIAVNARRGVPTSPVSRRLLTDLVVQVGPLLLDLLERYHADSGTLPGSICTEISKWEAKT